MLLSIATAIFKYYQKKIAEKQKISNMLKATIDRLKQQVRQEKVVFLRRSN